MKNIFLFLSISSLIFWGCKSTDNQKVAEIETEISFQGEKMEGDLFFGWLRIGGLYGKEYSSKKDISYMLDTINTSTMGADSAFLSLYKKLDNKDLLYSPYIEVVLENDVHTTWYLTATDYEKIKVFTLKDLEAKNKKVRIVADTKQIYQNAYQCFKILDIKILDKGLYKNSDVLINGKDYQ